MKTTSFATVALLLAAAAPAPAQFAHFRLDGVAGDLAAKIGQELNKRAPKAGGGDKQRVAVFAFGNLEGRYPVELGDNGPMLRGALVDKLAEYLDRNAPGKFSVLYPEQVDEELTKGPADPVGISGKNLALSRKLLKQFNLQVGIVGTFLLKTLPPRPDRRGMMELPSPRVFVPDLKDDLDPRNVKIETRVILPDADFQMSAAVNSEEVRRNGNGPQPAPSGRLGVRFFAKIDEDKPDGDASAWKQIPLFLSKQEKTENLGYLVVPRDYEGKRYKVVLTNRGKPALVSHNKQDGDRMFAASLFIDGANSFMRQDGKTYRAVSGQPDKLPRWVLTPLGKRLEADKSGMQGRIEGGKLVAAKSRATDHSQQHVRGFQQGRAQAGAFTFTEASASIAAPELWALKKIGTISVYFYREELTSDIEVRAPEADITLGSAGSSLGSPPPTAKMSKKTDGIIAGSAPPKPGTALGKEIKSKTTKVKVLNWSALPTEVWHILYRYEGDPEIPSDLRKVE
jgi:hypothetical protein